MKPGEEILELLFPTRCIICRDFLSGGKPRICPSCTEKLPYADNGGKRKGDFFSACASALYYKDEVRDAILHYKFDGARAYSHAFGRLLVSCIYEQLEGLYDVVTWVPLDRRRLRTRGYDQAQLLAEAACRSLECRPVRLLVKQRAVSPQSGAGSPEARKANITGAYRVLDPALVKDKRILIIDDIITTGSTLSECAKTLLLAGAESVVCASLACTEQED